MESGTEKWDSYAVTRIILLSCVLIVGALSAGTVIVGASTGGYGTEAIDASGSHLLEAPEALCRASDNGDKKNRNGREVWGPTRMNSQIGNQELTVSTNQKGTVTVFKWPNPSYADQIKHHAFDRRDPYFGADPNSGAFLGLIMTKEDGSKEFNWLREWGPVSTTDPEYGDKVDQKWASEFSDTLYTEYSNDRLGLTVNVTNAVPKDTDVFIRDVRVTADGSSPVKDVEVVSYANFNLVDDKDSLAPTQDWCSEGENRETAEYDSGTDAVLHYNPTGPWYEAGAEFSVATGMAFDGQSAQHQVAGDSFKGSNPNDPYKLLSDGQTDLPGDDQFTGQTSVAMSKDLSFDDGQGSARVYFAAAHDKEPGKNLRSEVAAKIENARSLSLPTVIQEKEDWFRKYVEDAPMPNTTDENVRKVSRRALVSIVQVWDGETENQHGFSGNIVASIATQAPYGADWIRDGAYFNYVLDRFMGQHDWVNKHNRWYMSLQQNKDGPCPEHCNNNMNDYNFADVVPQVSGTPEGTWAMNYYADGAVAGPIGGEIDETGYGAWTLWDHYAVTGNESYLQRIYPAIRLVGDRLTYDCVEESTGLQCPRPEDDNTKKTQTIIGGASAHVGLSSAAKAAAEMYNITGNSKYAEQARAYAERRDELGQAIESYYWNESGGYYGERKGGPSPRVGMPAFLRPYDDERMRDHMRSMWNNVKPTFQGERDQGQYEAKSLIGLGLAARRAEDPPVRLGQIRDGLEWIADKHAQPDTHIMGEAWVRETYADGEVESAVSQPHVWEQSLFYLSSLIAYGTEDARDRIGDDVYEEWNKHDADVSSLYVEPGPHVAGETVDATVVVTNNAEVSQDYTVEYTVSGPNGEVTAQRKDVGPISPGGSQMVTLTWTADSEGTYDATVSAWKAVGDPAEEPTALSNASYRHTELDSVSEGSAFEVNPPPAEASFSYSPSSPTTDDTVEFSDGSQGDIVSWSWDFGDGSTSTAQNPSHSYSSSGTYTVELQVTDSNGNTDTATRTIDVDSGCGWWCWW